MTGFDFHARTRIVFGAGALDRIGELAASLGRRVVVVTDAGLVAAGHVPRAIDLLTAAGLACSVFDATQENPTSTDVHACATALRGHMPDVLVALGGGSAIDTAKAANLLATSGGSMHDYRGDQHGRVTHPLLPMIAIPTTAGTGSEVQRFAVIADAATGQKMACGHRDLTPVIALLDPALTLTCPRAVTVHSGVDAIAHAIETAVTTRRNALSLMFSHEAAARLVGALPRVIDQPDDIDARGQMLLGAALAGLAIEQSMLGAAHAAANPLTARFGIVHGHAVGLLLPHVMRFNAAVVAANDAYADLALRLRLPGTLVEAADQLLRATGLAMTLRELGVTADAIPQLAADAAEQWTGRFNPRPVSAADFAMLFAAAL